MSEQKTKDASIEDDDQCDSASSALNDPRTNYENQVKIIESYQGRGRSKRYRLRAQKRRHEAGDKREIAFDAVKAKNFLEGKEGFDPKLFPDIHKKEARAWYMAGFHMAEMVSKREQQEQQRAHPAFR